MSVAAFPTYESYGDRGFERLGISAPGHWSSIKARFLFSFSKGLTITKRDLEDEGIPCVNYGEIHSKFGFAVDPKKNPLKYVSPGYLKTNEGSLLQCGDFIFADTSEDIEGSGNFTHLDSRVPTFAGYHTIIARPDSRVHTRYLAYMLDSQTFRKQVQRAVKGVKVYSITQGLLKDLEVLLPSFSEQRAIAAFLDEKCTKIDEAVRIREAQIELLRERQQIQIRQAVTRGLNPDAPMKDSGIDWVGQIPAHWELRHNKFIFSLKKNIVGKRASQYDLLSLTLRGIIKRDMENPEGKFPAEFDNYQEVQPGDFVFCHFDVEETPRTVGLSKNFGMISGAYTVYEPAADINAQFLKYFYIFADTDKKMRSLYKGLRNTIPKDTFAAFKTPLPPRPEQDSIVNVIDDLNRRTNTAISLKQSQITALKEYKTVLINAAVTGKIKITED